LRPPLLTPACRHPFSAALLATSRRAQAAAEARAASRRDVEAAEALQLRKRGLWCCCASSLGPSSAQGSAEMGDKNRGKGAGGAERCEREESPGKGPRVGEHGEGEGEGDGERGGVGSMRANPCAAPKATATAVRTRGRAEHRRGIV
jgi:hypothetical protein